MKYVVVSFLRYLNGDPKGAERTTNRMGEYNTRRRAIISIMNYITNRYVNTWRKELSAEVCPIVKMDDNSGEMIRANIRKLDEGESRIVAEQIFKIIYKEDEETK